MRTVHIVDIENLLGDPQNEVCFDHVFSQFRLLSGWQSGDLVVIAANRSLARRIAFDIPVPHRLLVSCGAPDAADHRLLDFVAGDWVERRFDRVVVASGDGIFAHLVERCGKAGLETVVVSHLSCLSRFLIATADRVCLLHLRQRPVPATPPFESVIARAVPELTSV